jgi:hypothetical protein
MRGLVLIGLAIVAIWLLGASGAIGLGIDLLEALIGLLESIEEFTETTQSV